MVYSIVQFTLYQLFLFFRAIATPAVVKIPPLRSINPTPTATPVCGKLGGDDGGEVAGGCSGGEVVDVDGSTAEGNVSVDGADGGAVSEGCDSSGGCSVDGSVDDGCDAAGASSSDEPDDGCDATGASSSDEPDDEDCDATGGCSSGGAVVVDGCDDPDDEPVWFEDDGRVSAGGCDDEDDGRVPADACDDDEGAVEGVDACCLLTIKCVSNVLPFVRRISTSYVPGFSEFKQLNCKVMTVEPLCTL